MANRNIQNIAQNWFALSSEEQDARIAEWLYRNHIPAIAEELLNQIYDSDDDDDENSSSGVSSDDSDFDADSDAESDADSDVDYHAEPDVDYPAEPDDDSDADSDSTLRMEEEEKEPFDPFKFDYSYDRHDGPPYEDEEEFDFSEEYAEACMAYDALDEPSYEEVIDR